MKWTKGNNKIKPAALKPHRLLFLGSEMARSNLQRQYFKRVSMNVSTEIARKIIQKNTERITLDFEGNSFCILFVFLKSPDVTKIQEENTQKIQQQDQV